MAAHALSGVGSFIFRGGGGALLALKLDDPVRGLAVTAVCGGIAGFACLIAWLHFLRRSPEIREVLAVTEDGTPDTTELAIEPADIAPEDGPARPRGAQLTFADLGCIGLGALAACDKPAAEGRKPPANTTETRLADSLVLTTGRASRSGSASPERRKVRMGQACVERGLEIRDGGNRVKVPLLYTGSPPVLLNDSTMRAVLWNHCTPG